MNIFNLLQVLEVLHIRSDGLSPLRKQLVLLARRRQIHVTDVGVSPASLLLLTILVDFCDLQLVVFAPRAIFAAAANSSHFY